MSDYELLNLCKASIRLMKCQGLFIHRSCKVDNPPCRTDETEIDIKTDVKPKVIEISQHFDEDDDELNEYCNVNDIIKKYKLHKLHLIYCIIMTLIKLCFSIYRIYLVFSIVFTDDLNANNSSQFVILIYQIAIMILYLSLSAIPIYFISINFTQSGFYKSVLSYEYIEKKIGNKSTKKRKRDIKILRLLQLFYLIFCSIFFFYTFYYPIESIITFDLKLMPISRIIFSVLILTINCLTCLDIFTGFYFILKNIVLVKLQLSHFDENLKKMIKNQVNRSFIIDIEEVRTLYKYLYTSIYTSGFVIFVVWFMLAWFHHLVYYCILYC